MHSIPLNSVRIKNSLNDATNFFVSHFPRINIILRKMYTVVYFFLTCSVCMRQQYATVTYFIQCIVICSSFSSISRFFSLIHSAFVHFIFQFVVLVCFNLCVILFCLCAHKITLYIYYYCSILWALKFSSYTIDRGAGIAWINTDKRNEHPVKEKKKKRNRIEFGSRMLCCVYVQKKARCNTVHLIFNLKK